MGKRRGLDHRTWLCCMWISPPSLGLSLQPWRHYLLKLQQVEVGVLSTSQDWSLGARIRGKKLWVSEKWKKTGKKTGKKKVRSGIVQTCWISWILEYNSWLKHKVISQTVRFLPAALALMLFWWILTLVALSCVETEIRKNWGSCRVTGQQFRSKQLRIHCEEWEQFQERCIWNISSTIC